MTGRPAAGAAPPRPSPLPWILAGAATFAVGLAVWLLHGPFPVGVWHDDGVYLLVAEALARGDGLRYAGVVGEPAATKFPPLWPLVLAVLRRLTGDAAGAAAIAVVLELGCVAAALALLGRWAHRALGLPVAWALGVVGAGALAPDLWRYALVALSEPLFLFLATAAVVAASGAEREGGSGPALAAGALAGAAFLTRSVGIGVGAAVILGLFLRRRPASAALAALPVAVAVGGWWGWVAVSEPVRPAELADILGGYGGWLSDQVARGPAAFAGGLVVDGRGELLRLGSFLVPGRGVAAEAAGLVGLTLAGAGVAVLARRAPAAALALLFHVGLVWLWPFGERRLLAPTVPLLLVAVAAAALALRDATIRRAGARRALLVAGAAWVVWYGAASASALLGDGVAGPMRARAAKLAVGVEAVVGATPPSAVVGAPELWAGLHLYTGRTVAPSAPFHAGTGGPSFGSPDEQIALWRAARIDHLFVEQGGLVHGAALDTLRARCPSAVRVLARMPGASLARLDLAGCPP